ncbi:TIGR03089 family protein [Cryptosporangium sp. NPDC048952]|uniref:TIGR03089 family protein n=1 Tax=Cryptosporangium sp. NPDC048952 TaxID=3363961 RepID=UPI0037104D0E
MSLPALFGSALPAEPDRPVLIYYDDSTGERTELTVRQLSGWAARTAGLLHSGCGLQIGDRAAVLLPPHWLTAGILLGAWAAGVSVSYRPWSTAGLRQPDDGPLDASFVSAARLRSWLDEPPLATHRFVLAATAPHPGYRDFLAESKHFSDTLPSSAPLRWTDAATADGTTYRQWGALAAEIAAQLDLHVGDRLLVDSASFEHPAHWLLAPLAASASVVVCAHLDQARLEERINAEGVTHTLL